MQELEQKGYGWLEKEVYHDCRLVDFLFSSTNTNAASGVLDTFRQQQFDEVSAAGFPTRKQEQWKYTDLSYLAADNFNLGR